MGRAGRPHQPGWYTPEQFSGLIEALFDSKVAAAAALGTTRETVYNWCRRPNRFACMVIDQHMSKLPRKVQGMVRQSAGAPARG